MASTENLPGPADSGDLALQLSKALAERDLLKKQNEALLDNTLNQWLVVADNESRILQAVYASLSWRITKPLRMVRTVQLKIKEVGLVRTSEVIVGVVKQRVGSKRR